MLLSVALRQLVKRFSLRFASLCLISFYAFFNFLLSTWIPRVNPMPTSNS